MSFPTVDRLRETNTAGGCKLQIVAATKVAVVPPEIQGTMATAITLNDGESWTEVLPTHFTQAFRADWILQDGDQVERATLRAIIPKDRALLLHNLWGSKWNRYLVLHHDRNGTIKLMGTKKEPAMVRIVELDHGANPRQDRNQYELQVQVTRRVPCPFYLATPPVVLPPGECPDLATQLSTADWDDDIEPNLSAPQLADAQAAICATLAAQLASADWDDDIEPNLSGSQIADAQASICTMPSGILYRFGYPLWSGERTSYGTGSEGDLFANGWYEFSAPAYPAVFARLDPSAPAPFSTLLDNNIFGNKNRFTDTAGGSTYANNQVIDHLTGLMWYRVVQTAAQWASMLTAAGSASHGGYTDWVSAPEKVIEILLDYELGANNLNYSPISVAVDLWTSTTAPSGSTLARRFITANGNTGSVAKTTSIGYLLCRKHLV